MDRFCQSISNQVVSEKLRDSIHGAGAFRRFKNFLTDHNMEDDWFCYRRNTLRDIAIKWCKDYAISPEKGGRT
jgi:hypothetical protein